MEEPTKDVQQDAAPYYRGEIQKDIEALRSTIRSAQLNVPCIHLSATVSVTKLLDVIEDMLNKAVS